MQFYSKKSPLLQITIKNSIYQSYPFLNTTEDYILNLTSTLFNLTALQLYEVLCFLEYIFLLDPIYILWNKNTIMIPRWEKSGLSSTKIGKLVISIYFGENFGD